MVWLRWVWRLAWQHGNYWKNVSSDSLNWLLRDSQNWGSKGNKVFCYAVHLWKKRKIYLLDASWHTNLPRFQGARPNHVRVESSNWCLPRELKSFDPWHNDTFSSNQKTYLSWEVHITKRTLFLISDQKPYPVWSKWNITILRVWLAEDLPSLRGARSPTWAPNRVWIQGRESWKDSL